jgi:hypothetical protein
VRVGRPRVGAAGAADELAVRRGRRGPQPEGAVHVHPCPVLRGRVADLGEWVARTRVDLAGLGADDRWALAVGQGSAERFGQHAARVIGLDPDHAVGAQPEQPDRAPA